MPNCRSIPPEVWEHARRALVMFFSRRHRLANAEDLAQETLAVLWSRQDFEFDREDDFLRVCYGFANKISLSGYRTARKYDGEALDPASRGETSCAQSSRNVGLNPVEATLLLDQVIRIAKAGLRDQDWRLIQKVAVEEEDAPTRRLDPIEANRIRVGLFRARKKLKELTRWGK